MPGVPNLLEMRGSNKDISHIAFFTATPGDQQNPQPIPAPSAASAGLAGLALVLLARRRRFLTH
jgi:hypothetical protein